MMYKLIAIICLLSCNAQAQELFQYPDGKVATGWIPLVKKADKEGAPRFYKARFMRSDTNYFLQVSVYKRKGTEGLLQPGNRIIVELLQRKGIVTLACTSGKVEEKWFYFATYPLATRQIDSLMQTKFVKMTVETPQDTIQIEGDNSLNFDWRSSASAIITERNINGSPIDIIKRKE